VLAKILYLYSKALFLTFNKQTNEANRFYEEGIGYYSRLRPGTDIEANIRKWYCYSLMQQGRNKEAMIQLEESQKIVDQMENRLGNSNIFAYVLVPPKVEAEKEFDIRLDIINAGKNLVVLLQTKDLLPSSFDIIAVKPLMTVKDGIVQMKNKQLNAIQDLAITFTIKASKIGAFTLNPQISFIDNLGQEGNCVPEPELITVEPKQPSHTPLIKQQVSPDHAKGLKPFDVFLCYKKSSGKDFADHLKAGLEELGFHTFLDSKDIPQITAKCEQWDQIRDKALIESPVFILLMTPGFELSSEVVKELSMARKIGDKKFIFFRIRSMGRKFLIKLDTEVFETGKQEQVSFETKEELLRLAHDILFKLKT